LEAFVTLTIWHRTGILIGVLALLTALVIVVGCEDDGSADRGEAVETQQADDTTEAPALQPQAGSTSEAPGKRAESASGAADNSIILPVTTAGVLVVERQGETTARVGERYEYSILLTNHSDHPAYNVLLKQLSTSAMQIDRVTADGRLLREAGGTPDAPTGVGGGGPVVAEHIRMIRPSPEASNTSAEASEGPPAAKRASTPAAAVRRWHLGVLAAGESREVIVSGFVRQEASFVSCLSVEYDPALCTPIEVVEPELELQRAFLVAGEPVQEAYSCDEIVAVYRAKNPGSGTTLGGVIRETLTEGLRTGEGDEEVEVVFAPLEAGETVSKEVPLVASRRLEYQGRAVATTGALETYSDRNRLRIMHPSLDLELEGPRQSYLGRVLHYEATVRNTSEDPAVKTEIQIQTSKEQVERLVVSTRRVVTGDDGEPRYDLGRLEAGERRRLRFSLEAIEPGMIELDVLVRAHCVEALRKTIHTEVRGVPALRMEMFDRTDPIQVGQQTAYEIHIENQGSAEDLNVQMQARLPENMTFVKAEGATEVTAEGHMLHFEPLERIGPGEVYSWLVQARADEIGKGRFELQVRSEATRKAVRETEPILTTRLSRVAIAPFGLKLAVRPCLGVPIGVQTVLPVSSGRFQSQFDQQRQMVRADWTESFQAHKGKRITVEDLIERPAGERGLGGKRTVEAPPDAGIEQDADLAK
jgi:uncharacterized repeat protein (TIGR01451 family)